MRSSSRSASNHPGLHFTNCYATLCEKRNDRIEYRSIKNLEQLDEYLSRNSVEGVRINQRTEPNSEILDSFDPNYAASPYTDEIEAVLYGKEELVTFGEEELLE